MHCWFYLHLCFEVPMRGEAMFYRTLFWSEAQKGHAHNKAEKIEWDWNRKIQGYNSIVEHIPSICEALGSIPHTAGKGKGRRKEIQLKPEKKLKKNSEEREFVHGEMDYSAYWAWDRKVLLRMIPLLWLEMTCVKFLLVWDSWLEIADLQSCEQSSVGICLLSGQQW